MGSCRFDNSGGESGKMTCTAGAPPQSSKQAPGGMGLILGRKAFQKPDLPGRHCTAQCGSDVYLDKNVTVA